MLGAVCGLRIEARILSDLGVATAIGAARRKIIEGAVDSLVQEGATKLVSFGTAGGLDPALKTGAIFVAREVVDFTGRKWSADPETTAALADRLQPCRIGRFLGTDSPLLDPMQKSNARSLTGGDIVDMESHVVAERALACGVPFLAVRAVLDHARMSVPAILAEAIDERGGIKALSIVRALLSGDVSLGALLELRAQMAAVRPVLFRCGAAIAGLRQ